MVRVSLVGGITFQVGDITIGQDLLAGRRARIALALLVLERHRRTTREVLAEAIWQDDLPPSWDSATRNVLSAVNRFLTQLDPDAGVALDRDEGGYALLLPADASVDLEEAMAAVARAEALLAAGDPEQARVAVGGADAVLSGQLLGGVAGEWVDALRDRVGEVRVQGLEVHGEACLAVGDHVGAVASAERALTVSPYRESLHRLLMRGHAAGGNGGEALRAYARCRRLLVEEMGVDPSPATEELYLALLGVPDKAAEGIGSMASPPPEPELVGRRLDEDAVGKVLRPRSLVTVTGPGGVGKTSLAAAVTASIRAQVEAVCWVDLAPVGLDGVVHAVAQAVGVVPTGAAATTVVSALRGGPTLLVLDNCEHVRPAVGTLVAELRAGCPDLRILATSRAPLNVVGEHVHALLPLRVPPEGAAPSAVLESPAAELFFLRATQLGARLATDDVSVAALAHLCRRLDGLPLALELAAARARVMSPGQIAQLLDQRFRLLHRGDRPTEDRHRSLLAAMVWSYEMLDDARQRVFRHLSVFSGTFGLDAACVVAGTERGPLDQIELLDVLGALVDHSMVALVASPDDQPRYRLLETLRELGAAKLVEAGEAEAAQQRHTEWFLVLAEAASVGLQGADEARWVGAMNADLPNVLAAMDRAIRSLDLDRALRFVAATFDYAFWRMRAQVTDLVLDAVALPGASDHPLYGAARGAAGYLAWQRGELDHAVAQLESVGAAADDWISADAWGTVSLYRGRLDDALSGYQRAEALAVEQGNLYLSSYAVGQRSFVHVLLGRDDAVQLAERSMAEAELVGAPSALAQAAWALGIARYDSDPQLALEHLDRCVALANLVDNSMAVGSASDPAEGLRAKLDERAQVDDLAAAVDALEYWVDQGHPPNVWVGLRRLIRQLAALGMHEDAALFAGAEGAAVLKIPPRRQERERHAAVVADITAVLGVEEFQRLAAAGSRLSEDELVLELRGAVERAGVPALGRR